MLADFNADTRYGWSPKKFTQHLKLYCQMAPHIHCLNPAAKTGRKADGERWVKRDGNDTRKTYFYVESENKHTEDSKTMKPEDPVLAF